MAILETQTFDALAQGADITAAALGPDYRTPTGLPTATSAAAAHGDRGAQVVNADGPYRVEWVEDAGNVTAARVFSFYFRLDSQPTANVYLAALRAGASADLGDFRVNSSGAVTARNGTTASGGTSAETLTVGTWYRAEWRVQGSTQELRIYEGESTTPYFTLNGALTAPDGWSGFSVGVVSSPNNQSLSFDTMRAGDDWVGPFGTPEAPLDTPANFTFTAHPGPNVIQITADADNVSGASTYQLEVEVLQGGSWVPFDSFSSATLPIVLDESDSLVGGQNYRGRLRALPAGW